MGNSVRLEWLDEIQGGLFMVTNATNCKDCIKADVCSKKDEFTFAFTQIENANTGIDDNMSYHKAKDNAALVVTVRCVYFAEKTGLLARYR
jgi:hypothetical protein